VAPIHPCGKKTKKEISLMHKKIYTLVSTLFCSLLTLSVWAQANVDPKKAEMADKFRADGKIYVVIAVLVTILLGLFIYVARLDKKINKLEKDFNK
jgi:energy-converting hydrogenase Eha subunit H